MSAETTVISLPLETQVNESYRLARSCAETAVQHALRCGQLLLEQKERLEHGAFGNWIADHCEFEQSTATRYMAAARQNATGVGISALSKLFPSGRKAVEHKTRTVRSLDDDHHHGGEHYHDDGTEITTDQAISILEPIISQSQLIARYRGWRGKVGKLRNKLRLAEVELARAESALIGAALNHRGMS